METTVAEGEDDIGSLPIPPEAKAMARKRGLKSMIADRTGSNFRKLAGKLTNQINGGSTKLSITDVGVTETLHDYVTEMTGVSSIGSVVKPMLRTVVKPMPIIGADPKRKRRRKSAKLVVDSLLR